MMKHEQSHASAGGAEGAPRKRFSENGTPSAAWRPLRVPMFRNLLIADLVSDVGTFMQGVGAAWLMVSAGAGPLLVALTQTASALPFFLLALLAGALGDIFDRRKLIIATEIWMAAVATALAVLTLMHWITPWMLLLLTLALSIGDALEAPTWRAILPEVIPQEDLLPAIALNGIEFNLARAVGPALGGFLIAAAGVGAAFTLNAVSFVAVLWVIVRWRRLQRQSSVPRETVSGAIREAVRYTQNTPSMLTLLARIAVIMFFASTFWALLPTVAHQLRQSASLYGLLLTVFGAGAILGALVLQRTQSFLSVDATLTVGSTIFAACLWATATLKSVALLCIAIALGGAAWTAVMSLMSTVLQNVAPDWVRARASAIFMLVYMGAWSGGSAFWGYVAAHRGTRLSLVAAAIGTAASPLLILISRLPDKTADFRAWDHWGKPVLALQVRPDQGPVLVTVEYEIAAKDSNEFVRALEKFSRVRRRDGASRWAVYYDTEHPTHYLETFVVESWGEHLRQHTRLTLADREAEERVQQFVVNPAKVKHFIYARSNSPT
ncbi:MAG TPA: MFS transporter [Candidatus Acidoferrales bacterium]|nr:MFS transporter [Candidatus Acidoferrales bacterium]